MRIYPVSKQNTTAPKFGKIDMTDSVMDFVCKKLNDAEFNEFRSIIKSQYENPVNILFFLGRLNTLKAKLYCPSRLKEFKSNYTQNLLFETKFDFIKRMRNIAEKYKSQLK